MDLSSIEITLLGKMELFAWFSFVCGLYTVSHGLFVLPLGVIGRLCSVIVVIPGYPILFLFFCNTVDSRYLELAYLE